MSNFDGVLHDELDAVAQSRSFRKRNDERQAAIPPRKVQAKDPSGKAIEKEVPALKRASDSQLLGLAFSGGGIRSATFNLGVLQALADLNLLKRFDYLSTVSGGGYIGSWLTAWIHRTSFNEVVDELKSDRTARPDPPEPREVRWLRRYSNYLTPRLGLFSGDTWAFIGAYLRNTSLNLAILILALIPVVLLPRLGMLVFLGLANTPEDPTARWSELSVAGFSLALAAVLLFVALALALANLMDQEPPPAESSGAPRLGETPWYQKRLWIYGGIILPFLSAAFLLWCAAWSARSWLASWSIGDLLLAGLGAGVSLLLLWLAGWFVARNLIPTERRKQGFIRQPGESGICPCRIVFSSAAGGFLGAILLWWQADQFRCYFQDWHQALWGVPLVVGLFLTIQTLHIGLAGSGFTEREREWWGRLGGILLISNIALSALVFLVLDGPWVFLWLEEQGYWSQWVKWAAGAAWAAITGGGVLAGRSESTGGGKSPAILSLLGKVAPPAFIAGLVLLLAFGAHSALDLEHQCKRPDAEATASPEPCSLDRLGECLSDLCAPLSQALSCWTAPAEKAEAKDYWASVENSLRFGPPSLSSDSGSGSGRRRAAYAPAISFGFILLVIGLCGGAAYLLSYTVGINEFSMHYLYRNRLVRCYLGASRDKRNPQPFTGFDLHDDLSFCDVAPDKASSPSAPGRAYPGPYHIINAAINLVAGNNLAWQQRKAASFVVTPRYSGYQIEQEGSQPPLEAYALTKDCAGGGKVNPLTLGMAVATSGAAASPNMGYQSSPTWAFLMTIFNVRLGWWLQNPNAPSRSRTESSGTRQKRAWQETGPKLGLFYLLKEMIGETNENAGFVYLSDGGHFENLGIYELVRRRCRYIVACDAGADPQHTFEDLGNALEKCRADFGINIAINVDQIRKEANSGKCEWHCAVGRIEYDKVDDGASQGTLLYIKASLTGDEPTDVLRYASLHKDFPHESTADQWFDESQFESYRMLGHHTTGEIFEAVGDVDSLADLSVEQIFTELHQRWYPRSKATEESFTKHTATYRALLNQLKENKDLKFLDTQLFPEWSALMTDKWKKSHPERRELWLPETEQELRAGFYFCCEMIQLLEDAYLDLDFEAEWDHPDNRGWMNLMQHCAWSGMFLATYSIAASLYGARFQKFCQRRLDLRIGEVRVGKAQVIADRSRDGIAAAAAGSGLNFWEAELTRTYLHFAALPQETTLLIVPFQIYQPSLRGRRPFEFNFGFALLSGVTGPADARPAQVEFFRVQNHLRRSGLGRQALRRLVEWRGDRPIQVRENALPLEVVNSRWEQLPAEERFPRDSALWEAVPAQEEIDHLRRMLDAVR